MNRRQPRAGAEWRKLQDESLKKIATQRKSDFEELKEILLDQEFELVSYGLAPNPNGFCYEFIGERPEVGTPQEKELLTTEKRLSKLLDGLTEKQTETLRREYL